MMARPAAHGQSPSAREPLSGRHRRQARQAGRLEGLASGRPLGVIADDILPEEDPVRALADGIDVGIVAYKAGVEPIAKTKLNLSLAAQQLAEAEAAFDATMEKVFGLLAAHFERRAVAGSFFPA